MAGLARFCEHSAVVSFNIGTRSDQPFDDGSVVMGARQTQRHVVVRVHVCTSSEEALNNCEVAVLAG